MGELLISLTLVFFTLVLVTCLTLILPPTEDSLSKPLNTPEPSFCLLVKIHCVSMYGIVFAAIILRKKVC